MKLRVQTWQRHLWQPRLGREVNTAKERICTTWAGWAALDPFLACHQELQVLSAPQQIKTKGTSALGAQFPEGLVYSGFLGQKSAWISPPYTSQDPSFKIVLRVQFPPLLPEASSPKVQHSQVPPTLGLQGPFIQCYVPLGMGARPAHDWARVRKVREPGPGLGTGGPGVAEGPRPPKLLQQGCTRNPQEMPLQPSRAGMARLGG